MLSCWREFAYTSKPLERESFKRALIKVTAVFPLAFFLVFYAFLEDQNKRQQKAQKGRNCCGESVMLPVNFLHSKSQFFSSQASSKPRQTFGLNVDPSGVAMIWTEWDIHLWNSIPHQPVLLRLFVKNLEIMRMFENQPEIPSLGM